MKTVLAFTFAVVNPNKYMPFNLRFILFLCCSYTCSLAQPALPETEVAPVQITVHNKFGFIDSAGGVVIEPKYVSAGNFSEGLAAARLSGLYGYINRQGQFVIQPRFDYATDFNNGLALVYIDGVPLFINKQGQKAFDFNFKAAWPFYHGRARVQTNSYKQGYIDTKGRLLIDTAYVFVSDFSNGLAVVDSFRNETTGHTANRQTGVIDTLGKLIIPFGVYDRIGDFDDGYFKVEMPNANYDSSGTGFVDATGKLIVWRNHAGLSFIDGDLHNGLAKMFLHCKRPDEESSFRDSYQGYMNLKGDIAMNDTSVQFVYDFACNRAFIKDFNWHFWLINTQGKKVCAQPFEGVLETGFKNGVAFVETRKGWGLIDTNANFIIQPHFEGIEEQGMVGNYFFFRKYNPDKKSTYETLAGIAKSDGTVLLNECIQQYDHEGFKNGLLRCVINNKLAYVNTTGKIVWQRNVTDKHKLYNPDIDFMNRGYFYAAQQKRPKRRGDEHYQPANLPHKITNPLKYQRGALSVLADVNHTGAFDENYKGFKVYVANNSKDTVVFNVQDGRLYANVQALNKNGQWKDIEFLPNSWCGNSYGSLYLAPGNYWQFTTPRYTGDFKTKLRIQVSYVDSMDPAPKWKKKQLTIYSNEYNGSINPAQFWRKPLYIRGGIMDPYNE